MLKLPLLRVNDRLKLTLATNRAPISTWLELLLPSSMLLLAEVLFAAQPASNEGESIPIANALAKLRLVISIAICCIKPYHDTQLYCGFFTNQIFELLKLVELRQRGLVTRFSLQHIE